MNQSNNEPNPKVSTAHSKKSIRRFFRFSLRTMLLVMTIFSIMLFAVRVYLNRTEAQKQAVAWVLRNRGLVEYSHQTILYDEDYERFRQEKGLERRTKNNFGWEPKWLREYFGVDFFYSVEGVHLNGPSFVDEEKDLSMLKKLPNLKRLNLKVASISGYSSLSSLTKLEVLSLSRTIFQDISLLRNLKSLKRLYLRNSRVTDISGLGQLKELQILEIRPRMFSKEHIAKLQEKLPKCSIRIADTFSRR